MIFSMAPAVSHRAFPLSTAKLEDSDSLDWRASDASSSCIYGCLDGLLVLDGWEKCKCCLTKKLPAKISDVIISVVIYCIFIPYDIK